MLEEASRSRSTAPAAPEMRTTKQPEEPRVSRPSLAELRQPHILTFDTAKYPLREALLAWMMSATDPKIDGGPFPALEDLSQMHTFSNHKCSEVDKDKAGNDMGCYQSKWNRLRDQQGEVHLGIHQQQPSPQYQQFDRIYKELLRDVIGPSIGGGRVLYQRAPTFRTYLPSVVPMGKMHNDESYHHQPSELNIWLPISNHVSGNNSLWVESSPAKGDFHPLNLEYGQIFRGWLNQCRHFTQANDTGYTRVSIDFRVVSEDSGGHDPSFHAGVRRGAKACFQTKFDVGGFYDEMHVSRGCHGSGGGSLGGEGEGGGDRRL